MRLYIVELRRGLSRLLIRVLAILAVLNFVVAGVIVFVLHDTDAEAATKTAAAAQLHEDCLDGTYLPPGTELPDFFEEFGPVPVPGGPGEPALAPELDTLERETLCAEERDVALSEVRRFSVTQIKDVTNNLTALLTILTIVIGASMIGAEWQARTITTHLTWEPRRVRAFVAKALAAVTIGAAFFLFTQVVEVVTLYPSAVFRGITEAPPGFWGDLFGLIGRATVATGVGAALGFAIASVTTSTVFALGFAFLLSILDGLLSSLVWRDFQRYALFRNMGGYVSGEGVPEFVFDRVLVAGRSPGGSGVVIVAWAIILTASATLIFRQRDIA